MRILRSLMVLVVVLGLTACGRDGEREQSAGLREASPSPGGLSGPASGDDEAGQQDGEPGRAPLPGRSDGSAPAAGGATPAPVQPAPEGGINRPRPGDYVFNASGASAWDPGGEFRQTATVTADGEEYTIRTSSARPTDGATTVRTRWQQNRVQLLSMLVEIPGQRYECTFEPALTILRVPIRAESYGAQTGRGQDCEVTVDVRILGREDVEVPAGSFGTWKTESTTRYRFGQDVNGTVSGNTWFSPDLGFEVRGERTNEGTFRGQQTRSTVSTQLRSHP